jgi:hypothetical protein
MGYTLPGSSVTPLQWVSFAPGWAVKSLFDFQSYAPNCWQSSLTTRKEQEAAVESSADRWFNPSEAVPVVKAPQVHVEQARFSQDRGQEAAGIQDLQRLDHAEDVIRELRDLRQALSHAERAETKFRLLCFFWLSKLA